MMHSVHAIARRCTRRMSFSTERSRFRHSTNMVIHISAYTALSGHSQFSLGFIVVMFDIILPYISFSSVHQFTDAASVWQASLSFASSHFLHKKIKPEPCQRRQQSSQLNLNSIINGPRLRGVYTWFTLPS